jgi:hypothetical protein
MKLLGKGKEANNLEPLHEEDTQTGARGKDSDPQEQTKSLIDLESEMIQNIVQTISGGDKPIITERLHCSIRKCVQTYIADALLLRCVSQNWILQLLTSLPSIRK